MLENNSRWFLASHPSDRVILGLLVLAVVVNAGRMSAGGKDLPALLATHVALLVGFGACVAAMQRWELSPWVQWLRLAATVVVVFSLYTSLGKLGVAAMPYLADGALARFDTKVLGFNPTFALEPFQTPGRVEFFSFIYGAFIPYINLSLVLGCLSRPPGERDEFLTGWVLTYAISYLGYIFVPAHGPVVYHAADYDAALTGGMFYDTVVRANELSGGLQGVFPSLHVGGSVYLCLFDLKTNRLRGLTYLPIVLLIYAATLMLRYHYVVDLVVGTVLAVSCVPLGRRIVLHWMQRRQAAGWPALPGSESDALPGILATGSSGAASVFSTH
jgi:hypothetical protein